MAPRDFDLYNLVNQFDDSYNNCIQKLENYINNETEENFNALQLSIDQLHEIREDILEEFQRIIEGYDLSPIDVEYIDNITNYMNEQMIGLELE